MSKFLFLSILAISLAGCESPPDPRRTNFEVKTKDVDAKYDPKSGRLKRMDIDQNKNGRFDTFSYWDGTKLDRIEIDRDEDGKIDRWEHYGDGNKLVSVGSSSLGDGVEDTWSYADEQGQLTRVETDTDRDGTVDKRETYVAQPGTGARVLSVVDLDIDKAGQPHQRLYYRTDGSFDRVETLK